MRDLPTGTLMTCSSPSRRRGGMLMRTGRANTLKPLSGMRKKRPSSNMREEQRDLFLFFFSTPPIATPALPVRSNECKCVFFNMTKIIRLILPAKKKKRQAVAGLRSEWFCRSSRVQTAKSRSDAFKISSSSTSFAVIFALAGLTVGWWWWWTVDGWGGGGY